MSLRQPVSLPLVAIGLAVAAGTAATVPVRGHGRGTDSVEPQQQHQVVGDEAAASSIVAQASRGLRWQTIEVPNIGRVRMAAARPSGRGPFQTIVILHGSHGFAAEYLDLARDLSRGGVLAVAVCWFSGGVGQGRGFIRPLDCPEGAPAIPLADSEQSFATIDAVVAAVRAMPDSRDDQIALFGHSRGGGAVRNYVLRGGRVQAGIMNSAGYDPSRDLSQLSVPILILHGTADGPADGGSPFSAIGQVRAFETAVRAARKPVEAHYYRGGTHNGMFADRRQRRDEVRRILQFMRRHLR